MANTFHYNRGGASIYVLELSKMLEERGVEVLHFAMNHPKSLPAPETERFWPEYIDFPELMAKGAIKGGMKVLARTISSKEAERGMAALLSEYKIDIVHCNNILHHLTPSIFKPVIAEGIPSVWTLHDYSLICPNTSAFDERRETECSVCLKGFCHLYNAPLKRCKKGSFGASAMAALETACHKIRGVKNYPNLFIAPCRFLAQRFTECGFDRVVTVPNFYAPSSLKDTEPRAGGRAFALYAGRLSSEKGLKTLIEAWREMPPEYILKIAGSGPKEAELKTLASGLENIVFLGFVEPRELSALRDEAAFMIVPSEWWENAPLTILEAFASGIPVLGANIGGIPEMVRHGETGLLFEPRSYIDLREKAIRLFENPELAKALGENSRRIAMNEYSPEIHVERILSIYRGLIEGKKRP